MSFQKETVNRRRFLFLLTASAAAAVVPSRVFSFPTNIVIADPLGDYADYVNFSDLLCGYDISPLVEKISRELAQRLSLSMEIYLQNFDDAGVRTATGIMLAK